MTPMIVCIKRSSVQAYCGRYIEDDEHAFEDVDHALAFYIDNDLMRACPGCVQVAQSRDPSFGDLTHVVKRGISKDDL